MGQFVRANFVGGCLDRKVQALYVSAEAGGLRYGQIPQPLDGAPC